MLFYTFEINVTIEFFDLLCQTAKIDHAAHILAVVTFFCENVVIRMCEGKSVRCHELIIWYVQ